MNRNTLSSVAQKFILHWGEMGTRWGINRTVAQIHALLFLSPRPLPAEEIATTLAIARSNVSNSLHELQSWGIVRVVHVQRKRSDRKSTRLNSSHITISYAVFCLKKKNNYNPPP